MWTILHQAYFEKIPYFTEVVVIGLQVQNNLFFGLKGFLC